MALPLFLAAGLAAHDITGFKLAFAIEMLIFNAATVWLVAGWVERTQGGEHVRMRLARYTALYVLLSRWMVSRFDGAAMFLGFSAATWWFNEQPTRGGVAAGMGALMKVYPAVVAVVAAPWDLSQTRPERGRGVIAFAAALLLGSLAWLAMGGARGVGESLDYQLGRGFEYGSLYSGLQMLAAKVAGAEVAVVRDRAAWASITPWSPALLWLVLPVQAATILSVCIVFSRRGMAEGVRFSGAAILAFIITGKVFSPQYLLWMLPFVAVLERPIARLGFWLFAAGCAATLIAPALTGSFSRTSLTVILAYNVKNALFLMLLALLAFGPGAVSVAPGREPSS
jgi:hypothetical protein